MLLDFLEYFVYQRKCLSSATGLDDSGTSLGISEIKNKILILKFSFKKHVIFCNKSTETPTMTPVNDVTIPSVNFSMTTMSLRCYAYYIKEIPVNVSLASYVLRDLV